MADIELLIKIDEEVYKKIIADKYAIYDKMYYSIKNGTPIPDNASVLSVTEFADKCRECGKNYVKIPNNATNGDVIKAMFPNSVVLTDILAEIVEFETEDDGCEMRCTVDWWNAPYQKGGKR